MTTSDPTPPRRKKGMPRGMYIGSGWIGFAVLMFLCWILAIFQSTTLLQEGLGELANYRLLLNLMAIFGFGIPMIVGLSILRRAGREARQQALEEQEQQPLS